MSREGSVPCMSPRSLRRGPALPIAIGLAVAALAILGVVLVLNDDDRAPPTVAPAPEPDPGPEPDPEPEPEPPRPPPVHGDATLGDVVDLSVHGTQLFGDSMPQDEPVPIEDDAVDAFLAAIARWLDDHLTELQDGGPGALSEAGLEGDAGPPLADDDHLVASARYDVTVYARGVPEWGRVDVEVERLDGSVARRRLVFVPGEEPSVIGGETIEVDLAQDPDEDDRNDGDEPDDAEVSS